MKRPRISTGERLARLARSGAGGDTWLAARFPQNPQPPTPGANLQERLALLRLIRPQRMQDMMCIIAYDIESNKVRNQIAKFLIRKGCYRLQKSVYFGQMPRKQYKEMVAALRAINNLYENEDSLFFLPVGEDSLNRLEVVGRGL